jgi:hypothetical protein
MWMDLGLLGAAGLIPVVVIVAIFEARKPRRAEEFDPLS